MLALVMLFHHKFEVSYFLVFKVNNMQLPFKSYIKLRVAVMKLMSYIWLKIHILSRTLLLRGCAPLITSLLLKG